jgi:hypothetical protein
MDLVARHRLRGARWLWRQNFIAFVVYDGMPNHKAAPLPYRESWLSRARQLRCLVEIAPAHDLKMKPLAVPSSQDGLPPHPLPLTNCQRGLTMRSIDDRKLDRISDRTSRVGSKWSLTRSIGYAVEEAETRRAKTSYGACKDAAPVARPRRGNHKRRTRWLVNGAATARRARLLFAPVGPAAPTIPSNRCADQSLWLDRCRSFLTKPIFSHLV